MVRRAHVAALLAAGAVLAAAPAAAESPEAIFERGNDAYDAGRYAEAAEAYDTLLRYRIEDPRVEYNLGNAYFKLGHLGRAILHFERARRLDPVDGDIRTNLEFARTFCYDKVEPAEVPAVLEWIVDVQDRVGPDRQAIALVVLLWLAGGALVWGLARPGAWRARHGWSLAVLLILAAFVAGSWWLTWHRLEGRPTGVVLAEAVEVRAGPGASNPALFTVHEGLTIEVRDVRDDWVQVSLPNGLNGWLSRDALGLV